MLYNLKDILQIGNEEGYAIAAFNVYGYEDAVAVVEAAEELKKPVILMANKDAIEHMSAEFIGEIMIKLAKKSKVPVCVHLDHATSIESIKDAIDVGFTSVMIDGSQLPFDDNVAITKEVVAMAHPKNISVEAEIGAVGYSDPAIDFIPQYTEPDQAKEFAELTNVDALAVAVGTVHRMVTQSACLQFERLKKIKELVSTPLVIHGSTGVADEDLVKLVKCGVRKINLGTTLRLAFGNTLRQQFNENPKEFDRIKLFKKCMLAVKETAKEKIKLLSLT
ncbi:MAG: class II fructose-bisphosphate aldolase [Thermoanaerobacteraceae bacterium]|nr:class II fructose-bisphosphate aldolase [Thermoanaerobacteraceae bacterium]